MLFLYTTTMPSLFFSVSSTWEEALFREKKQIPAHQLIEMSAPARNLHLHTYILQIFF